MMKDNDAKYKVVVRMYVEGSGIFTSLYHTDEVPYINEHIIVIGSDDHSVTLPLYRLVTLEVKEAE
jgi:hypothetical protein